jgi:hypothetical protein
MLPECEEDEGCREYVAAVRVLADPAATAAMLDAARDTITSLVYVMAASFRGAIPESLVLDQLNLEDGASMATRLARAECWVDQTDCPAPWAALILVSALTVGGDGIVAFLRADRQYRTLGGRFAGLAARQSLDSWAAATRASLEFWGDVRGDFLIRVLLENDVTRNQQRVAWNEERNRLHAVITATKRTWPQKLERRLGRAKVEVQEVRNQLAVQKREHAELNRLLLQARQARDRAVERTQAIEVEMAALRNRLPVDPDESGRTGVPRQDPDLVAAPPPLRLVDAAPSPDAIFAGRHVYLFTGAESAGMRREMGRAFERHGATSEVFDGNRLTDLGPERFERDALVVIETRNLCHAANDLLLERARASGAWYFVGPSGAAGLARKVAERWARGGQRGRGTEGQ